MSDGVGSVPQQHFLTGNPTKSHSLPARSELNLGCVTLLHPDRTILDVCHREQNSHLCTSTVSQHYCCLSTPVFVQSSQNIDKKLLASPQCSCCSLIPDFYIPGCFTLCNCLIVLTLLCLAESFPSPTAINTHTHTHT